MRDQPDFDKIFRDYFGDAPGKVVYEVRHDPNRVHDIYFLSSLIHDAQFRRESVRFRGKRMTILVERPCWDLESRPVAKRSGPTVWEQYVVPAVLTIQPVVGIEWRYQRDLPPSPEDELDICYLWLDRPAAQVVQDDERVPIMIAGFGWDCIATVLTDEMKIRLRDLGDPYLPSQRGKTERGNLRARKPAKKIP